MAQANDPNSALLPQLFWVTLKSGVRAALGGRLSGTNTPQDPRCAGAVPAPGSL